MRDSAAAKASRNASARPGFTSSTATSRTGCVVDIIAVSPRGAAPVVPSRGSGRMAALSQMGLEQGRALFFESRAGEQCLAPLGDLLVPGERPPGCRPQALTLRLDRELLRQRATGE